jgi:FlaA1/EpsC-like NDP-sugar epimerase
VSSDLLIRYRRALIVAGNASIIPAAYATAFLLRFDFDIPPQYWRILLSTVVYLVLIRLVVFQYFGLFSGYWRHVSMADLVNLVTASTISSGIFLVALFLSQEVEEIPRSILFLDWLLVIFFSGGLRFAARWIQEGRLSLKPDQGKRTLVIGSGESAAWLMRQPVSNGHEPLLVVYGVPVVGGCDDLQTHVVRYRPELIVIAIAAATGEQIRRIVSKCKATGVEFKIIPSVQELLAGKARVNQLREVSVEDLLGRAPVNTDLAALQDLVGKRVLVTGAAGSIGSELARQIASFCPSELILLDQAESPLYFIHRELREAYPDVDALPLIVDITDQERVDDAFRRFRPEYVFHAAAYKHVPLLESNRFEAVNDNVLGSVYVAEAAAQYGARRFVLISSDKAVNPRSMLGVTKRIAERVVLELDSLNRSGTDFRAVRFGNVLGSQGSVIPVFKNQIAAGGPVTVTHPEVERFFMTIPEAVQLVLQAAVIPEATGRICMLEMGRSMRIVDLAEQLIILSGLVPYQDVDIVFTGLRPGEKMKEELVGEKEATLPTSVSKIRIVQNSNWNGADLKTGLIRLNEAARGDDPEAINSVLCELVPEFVPWSPPLKAVSPSSPPSTRPSQEPGRQPRSMAEPFPRLFPVRAPVHARLSRSG